MWYSLEKSASWCRAEKDGELVRKRERPARVIVGRATARAQPQDEECGLASVGACAEQPHCLEGLIQQRPHCVEGLMAGGALG